MIVGALLFSLVLLVIAFGIILAGFIYGEYKNRRDSGVGVSNASEAYAKTLEFNNDRKVGGDDDE